MDLKIYIQTHLSSVKLQITSLNSHSRSKPIWHKMWNSVSARKNPHR